MKEKFQELAEYNLWANKLMVKALQKLTPEQLDKPVPSSFDTIRKTVYHSWGAEFVWLQRLQLIDNWVYVGNDLHIPFDEACGKWLETGATYKAFINKQFGDNSFTHVFQYYDSEKVLFKQQVGHVLQHVFNHATYHRGQLITMLRQVGQIKLPTTDFMIFVRRK